MIRWATVCQAFILTYQHSHSVGRIGFTYLVSSIDAALENEGFTERAFAQIVENRKSEFGMTRTAEAVVVDTFVMEAATILDDVPLTEDEQTAINRALLTNQRIFDCSKFLCYPMLSLKRLNEVYLEQSRDQKR